MPRNPHFAVDDLSEQARAIIRHGIEQRRRESAIIADVRKATREKISSSSLNRYATWFRAELARRSLVVEQTEVACAAAVKNGAQMTEGIRALALEHLYELDRAGELAKEKPFLLARIVLDIAESARKEKELLLKQGQLELAKQESDRKLAEAQAKLKDIDEKVKKAVAPENLELTEGEKKRIRSIYGTE